MGHKGVKTGARGRLSDEVKAERRLRMQAARALRATMLRELQAANDPSFFAGPEPPPEPPGGEGPASPLQIPLCCNERDTALGGACRCAFCFVEG